MTHHQIADITYEAILRLVRLKAKYRNIVAASVIFVHNHPSGDPEASEDDIKLTKRLAEAGGIVGIDVLDHIIIGDKKYLSLKREGLF